MKHLFYFIGILFALYELYGMFTITERVNSSRKIKKLIKEFKNEPYDNWSSEFKKLVISKGLIGLFFILWMFIGLFTFNWVLFAAFILLQCLIIYPLGKIAPFSMFYTILVWTNSLIGFLLSIFLILNAYHFNIDFWELIKTLFYGKI